MSGMPIIWMAAAPALFIMMEKFLIGLLMAGKDV
jgi:hypothetical protein